MFRNAEEFATWLTDKKGEPFTTLDRLYGDCYGIVIWTEDDDIDDYEMIGRCAHFFEGPFAGEFYGLSTEPCEKGGKLFYVNTDFTKCRRDDLGDGLDLIENFFMFGSEPRKTNRKGPIGSRAI